MILRSEESRRQGQRRYCELSVWNTYFLAWREWTPIWIKDFLVIGQLLDQFFNLILDAVSICQKQILRCNLELCGRTYRQ